MSKLQAKVQAAGALPVSVPRVREGSPLPEFLLAVRPKAELVLSKYLLEAAVAEEILQGTLQTLAWKWESVRDREQWLLAVLEGRCRTISSRLRREARS